MPEYKKLSLKYSKTFKQMTTSDVPPFNIQTRNKNERAKLNLILQNSVFALLAGVCSHGGPGGKPV